MKKVFGLVICSALLFSCNSETDKPAESADSKTASSTSASSEYEISDGKYVEVAKKHTGYLETGDIDSWLADFADNAIYRWNNLDSLVGKAAISEYWKKRRTDIIDSMSFASPIWLPVKVHKPQAPGHLTGDYVLSWYIVKAKYKGGGTMTQRIHNVFHFNADGKIDRMLQYLDREPIIKAMGESK